MLPILQLWRLGILTSFTLRNDFGALDLRLGCFPLDNDTWLSPSDYGTSNRLNRVYVVRKILPPCRRSEFYMSW